ncbi:MAG: M28 family peptidase [Deltaproteobacteria bacterium]|nr:MAG: M28 family peptidase [Deltaproteobacteria bacterium]
MLIGMFIHDRLFAMLNRIIIAPSERKKVSGIWRGIALTVILALISGFAVSARTEEELGKEIRDEMVGEFSDSMSKLVLSTLKKLPGWLRVRKEANKLLNQIPDFPEPVPVPDEEEIFSWIEGLASFSHRRPGSPEAMAAEDYLVRELEKTGITGIKKEPIELNHWEAGNYSLAIETEEGYQPFPCFYVPYSGFTREEGVVAEMVYIGKGRPKDFAGREVRGKIVVAEVPFVNLPYGLLLKLLPSYYFSDPGKSIGLGFRLPLIFVRRNFLGYATEKVHLPTDVYWQSVDSGAAGIILILKDQPTNSNTHYGPYDGILKPLPGLWVGKYDGVQLRGYAKKGLKARLVLQGDVKESVSHNIYGFLPGQSERTIIIASHHDSPFQGAVEDGSGCAQVLAQARAWAKIPRERRPKTLLFLFTAGHFYASIGSSTFAKTHKHDLLKKIDLVFVTEHIAAKEAREAENRQYEFTGHLELGGIFTENQGYVVASVIKMLKTHPLERVVSVPIDFFGTSPPTDVSGFVLEPDLDVPVLSWITGPAYLLCAEDTLDKIEVSQLDDFAGATAGLVGSLMMLKSELIIGNNKR